MTDAELFEELITRMDRDIASGKYADKAKKESGFRSTQMCALLDQVIQAGVFRPKPQGPPRVIKIKEPDVTPSEPKHNKSSEVVIEESLPNIGPIELESEE